MPIALDRPVAEKAQEVGAMYGIAGAHAVHLASAIVAGCNVLLVWDKPTFLSRLPAGPEPDIRQVENVLVLEPYLT